MTGLSAAVEKTVPAVGEIRLEAAQAKGGKTIKTDKGVPAVLFPATDPTNAKIVWQLNQPLPPGLWQIDLAFYQPNTTFSPNQLMLFEGKEGANLGSLDLYYIGYSKGSFTRSVGLSNTMPLTALTLLKNRQRRLDTVSVVSIRIIPAVATALDKLQCIFQFPVKDQKVMTSLPLPAGLYVISTTKPVSLSWTLPSGKTFTTPSAREVRVYLDGPVQPKVTSGGPVNEIVFTRYPANNTVITVPGNPPLMTVTDPTKSETRTLVLNGYRGKDAPKLDLLPGGKTIAVVSSWDDGQLMDLPLAECLQKYGVKGTFYMNHHSKMLPQLRELEAKGMEVGSHSWSHPAFYNSSPKRCLDEAVEMRRFLEKELGHPVISFAYPYNYQPAYDADGDYVVRSLRQAGYWSGRATSTGDNRIDAIPEPLAMRPNFHYNAGAIKVKAKLDELLKKPGSVLYFWGHSYELTGDGMKKLEAVLDAVARRPDVWYATLGELMIWQYMRNHLKIEKPSATPAGESYTLQMPWLHPYLRQVPVSLTVPEGVTSVTWQGQTIPVADRRVQLKW